jgi:hypothetical protein
MGERLPMEFTAQCHQLKWLRNYLSGWQFGEQGLVCQILQTLEATGHCIEYGAGDGVSLPVTLDGVVPPYPSRRILVEIDYQKRESLGRMYAGDVIVRTLNWQEYVGSDIAVVVIDIDGKDSVVMREMVSAGVRPTLLVVEHMDRHVPIATTAPQPIPEWLLGQTLKSGHSIQDTAETLHQIALQNGYERIGWNRCNSFFLVKERFQELFR